MAPATPPATAARPLAVSLLKREGALPGVLLIDGEAYSFTWAAGEPVRMESARGTLSAVWVAGGKPKTCSCRGRQFNAGPCRHMRAAALVLAAW